VEETDEEEERNLKKASRERKKRKGKERIVRSFPSDDCQYLTISPAE